MDADIVLLGSSRCINHYNPQILEDSLHLKAFNAGFTATGILRHYPYYKIFTQRYHPKMIIYDVHIPGDLLGKDNLNGALDWVRPYYKRNSAVDSIFWKIDPSEKIKMLLHSYQYNNKLPELFSNYRTKNKNDLKGFSPKYGKMDYEPEQHPKVNKFAYNQIKLKYLEALIQDCSKYGTIIVFCSSPAYKATDNKGYQPIRELAKKIQHSFFRTLRRHSIFKKTRVIQRFSTYEQRRSHSFYKNYNT